MPPIWIIPEVIILVSLFFIRKKVIKKIQGKTVFFTGPIEAGKTTLINWILKKEPTTVYNPSAATELYKTYMDNMGRFRLYDMGGGIDQLSMDVFKGILENSDVVIFVFDVNKFVCSDEYRLYNVGARLDFIWLNKDLSKNKVLIFVATHKDELALSDMEIRGRFENLLKDKDYRMLFVNYPLILVNLMKEEGIKTVYATLEKELNKKK